MKKDTYNELRRLQTRINKEVHPASTPLVAIIAIRECLLQMNDILLREFKEQ